MVTVGTARDDAQLAADQPEVPTPRYRSRVLPKVLRVTGRVVLVIMSVAVLATTGYAWSNTRQLSNGLATTHVFDSGPADDAPAGLMVPPLTQDQNILLVGMDSRTDAHGNPLPANLFNMLHAGPDTGEIDTDTMILVHIPAGGGKAVAISFPRDSYVQLAGGYGKHRLNSAFAYAYNDKANQLRAQGMTDAAQIDVQAKEAGRKNLVATIELLLGNTITINRYAEINLYGFYQLSEAVGGVTVCLKQATYDDETKAAFPAGEQIISGVRALDFVRQRHGLPGGDLDRIVRQQAFLGALAQQVLSAGVLANPSRLQSLISAIQSSVTISSGWDIVTFAEQLQGLSTGKISFVTVPTEGDVYVGGADMLAVDPSAVQQFVREQVGGADAGPATPSTSPGVQDAPVTKQPRTSGVVDTTTNAPPTTTANPPGDSGNGSGKRSAGDQDTTAAGTISPGQAITADGTPCIN